MTSRLADDRGLILAWLARTLILVAIVVLAAMDGGGILLARLRAGDAASAGATACAATYRATRNAEGADAAARGAVLTKDDTMSVVGLAINPRSGACTVRTREVATTLVVKRVGFLKELGIVEVEDTADPPSA